MSEKRSRDLFRYQLWRVSGDGSRELVRDETIHRQDLEQRGDLDHDFPVETGGWMHIDFSSSRVINPLPPADISKPVEVRGDEQIPFFDEVRW